MLIACSTCSRPSGISRSLGAQIREPHIRFSLVKENPVVVNHSELAKPAINSVETSTFSCWATRDVWEQRSKKDMLGTWEIHLGGTCPNVAVETIRLDRPTWKSDTPIVVPERERGSGRRGVTVVQQPTNQGDPLV